MDPNPEICIFHVTSISYTDKVVQNTAEAQKIQITEDFYRTVQVTKLCHCKEPIEMRGIPRRSSAHLRYIYRTESAHTVK